MGHKCFISFKAEDITYKEKIQGLKIDMIDKSLDHWIDSFDEDYVMEKIRNDYLSDSTVTIHLIGQFSSENLGSYEQRYIKRELQASLFNSSKSPKSGILGIVLPTIEHQILKGTYNCTACGNSHNFVGINDTTVVREFSYNYYIPKDGCSWSEEERYCVLVAWDDFVRQPETYIDFAFDKRSQPIANKTKVRP